MKILVTGGREYSNTQAVLAALEEASAPGDIVIQGGAPGADTIADELANLIGLRSLTVRAEWDRLGRRAGPLRNIDMLDLHPDIVLAFHPNLDESRGTKHCVEEAIRRGIPVAVYE